MTFKVIGFQPITLVFRFPPSCWVSQSVSLCVWNISQFSCGPWENAWSRCTHWMLCKTRIPKFITFPPASVLFFFCFATSFPSAAPSLISELRAEKIEQKSITLVWRKPSYPNSSRTEYEVKYYEKVSSTVTSSSVCAVITVYGPQRSHFSI